MHFTFKTWRKNWNERDKSFHLLWPNLCSITLRSLIFPFSIFPPTNKTSLQKALIFARIWTHIYWKVFIIKDSPGFCLCLMQSQFCFSSVAMAFIQQSCYNALTSFNYWGHSTEIFRYFCFFFFFIVYNEETIIKINCIHINHRMMTSELKRFFCSRMDLGTFQNEVIIMQASASYLHIAFRAKRIEKIKSFSLRSSCFVRILLVWLLWHWFRCFFSLSVIRNRGEEVTVAK